MKNLINAFPLYNFLKYCNASPKEKIVLDCGAGGSNPPLSLFHEFGYETHGIERCAEQLEKAKFFCQEHHMELNIIHGDMTKIPFDNESFSFLFSYNTSVHIRKNDFSRALEEFYRVLKQQGLCYVNFLSEECDSYGHGPPVGQGEFMNMEQGEKVFYCHYTDKEIEQHFHKFEIIYKEKRIVQRNIEGEICTSAYYDYILTKSGVATMEEKNPNCPCKKVKCERHGNCVLCRKHHSSPKAKYLPACDRIKKKEN